MTAQQTFAKAEEIIKMVSPDNDICILMDLFGWYDRVKEECDRPAIEKTTEKFRTS